MGVGSVGVGSVGVGSVGSWMRVLRRRTWVGCCGSVVVGCLLWDLSVGLLVVDCRLWIAGCGTWDLSVRLLDVGRGTLVSV